MEWKESGHATLNEFESVHNWMIKSWWSLVSYTNQLKEAISSSSSHAIISQSDKETENWLVEQTGSLMS